MALHLSELDIDFGEVGYRNTKQAFHVRLQPEPLKALIEAAQDASRVYELLMIDRPGDLWDYVDVHFIALPTSLMQQVEKVKVRYARENDIRHWPDQGMPFRAFDSLFRPAYDDTLPEDVAWLLEKRESGSLRDYARLLLELARDAQTQAQKAGGLIKHEIARIHSGQHPYATLTRDQVRERSRQHYDPSLRYGEGFYAKLQEMLSDPAIQSVACDSDTDYRVLKLLAMEQLERTAVSGLAPRDAFPICMSSDGWTVTEAWGAEISYYQEGLGYGDLYIGSRNLRLPPEHRQPSKFVLTTTDCGEVDGYQAAPGQDHVLYVRCCSLKEMQ